MRGELSRLHNDASADAEDIPDKDNTPPSTAAEGAAKFSMTELYGKHRVSRRRALQRKDELNSYLASVDNFSDLQETFLSSDELGMVYYWKRRSSMYPNLYKVALRIFATPASSCQSERNFSAVNLVLTDNRLRTEPAIVEDILYLRSTVVQKLERVLFDCEKEFVIFRILNNSLCQNCFENVW